MKICFIGSSIDKLATNVVHIEINSILNVLIKRYDTLVCSGFNKGLMGEFVRGFKEKGGTIVSVIPEQQINNKLLFGESNEIIQCKSIMDKKDIMFKMSDDVICYPGGLDTIDELTSYLACYVNEGSFKSRNIFVYNHEKYYSPILLQLEIARDHGIITENQISRIKVFEYVDQLEIMI